MGGPVSSKSLARRFISAVYLLELDQALNFDVWHTHVTYITIRRLVLNLVIAFAIVCVGGLGFGLLDKNP